MTEDTRIFLGFKASISGPIKNKNISGKVTQKIKIPTYFSEFGIFVSVNKETM